MLKSIASGWGATVLSVVSTYLTLPIVLGALGNSQYGTFLILSAAIGYANLLSLGIPMAAVREFSIALHRGDDRDLSKLVATTLALFGSIALSITVLAVVAASDIVPRIIGEHSGVAIDTFILLAMSVSISFLALSPVGLLSASNVFLERNIIVAVGICLRLALTATAIPYFRDMRVLAAISLAVGSLELVATWSLVRRKLSAVSTSLSDIDWPRLRPVMAFGAYVIALNAASQLSFQTDSIVIGLSLDKALVPSYSVANSIVLNVLQLAIGIAAVVMPNTSRAISARDQKALQNTFTEWTTILILMALALFIFSSTGGESFISWWIDSSTARQAAVPFTVLSASCLVFLPARGVALPMLMGAGTAKRPTLAFLTAGFVNIVISVLLAPHWGLIGVALGTAIPNVVVGGYLLLSAAGLAGVSLVGFAVQIGRVLALPFLGTLIISDRVQALITNSSSTIGFVAAATFSAAFAFVSLILLRSDLPSFHRLIWWNRNSAQ